MPALGATQSGSAITCLNTSATAPPFALPPLNNIWSPSQMTGKALFIASAGAWSTATNTLTTIRLSLDTGVGTTANNTVASIGAVLTSAIGTTGGWYSYNYLTCIGVTGTSVSTWTSSGQISMGPGSNPTATTIDYQWSPAQIIGGSAQTISLTLGTSYYANLCSQWQANPTVVSCSQFLVFGLNLQFILAVGTEQFYTVSMIEIAEWECLHPERTPRIRGLCKPCYTGAWMKAHPDADSGNNWAKNHPEEHQVLKRRATLKRKYGITEKDFEVMWTEQEGKCANPRCEATFPLIVPDYRYGLQVDHDHKTDVIRKLLCGGCNRALGDIDDNTGRLEGLIEYLKSFGLN